MILLQSGIIPAVKQFRCHCEEQAPVPAWMSSFLHQSIFTDEVESHNKYQLFRQKCMKYSSRGYSCICNTR
uniref:Uncharacterized protein n=2 Tax=Anguilla anguilla TaxID=7936 RepID=A0A0E9QWY3_ANGAN